MCVAKKRYSLNPLKLACVQTPIPSDFYWWEWGGGLYTGYLKSLFWAPTCVPWLACEKRHCGFAGNSLSPLGAQNKDIGAASQTLLTGVTF